MTSPMAFDPRVVAYLDEGPTELPLEQRLAIVLATEELAQQHRRRPWLGVPGWPTDGTVGRRRGVTLALVLALLVAALLGTIVLVGSSLFDRLVAQPSPEQTSAPVVVVTPAAAYEIVRSAYLEMPKLPPLELTLLANGEAKRRIFVGASGAIRTETFDSPDAIEPAMYEILSGTRLGQLYRFAGETYWYEQADRISEDPRVFVYAATSGPGFASGDVPGCLGATDELEPGEENDWRYLGLETVLDRPVHHVACAGELWIDTETSLVLRSRGPAIGPDGWPIAGKMSTIEVVSLEFVEPPAALFEIEAPAAAVVVNSEQFERHQCVRFGACLESPVPLPTPGPADAPALDSDPNQLVVNAENAGVELPALEVALRRWNTGSPGPGATTKFLHDGAGRYRTETTHQPGTRWAMTSITLAGSDYRYTAEIPLDGSTTWWSETSRIGGFLVPIEAFFGCGDAWEAVGVDLVAGRVADHLACPTGDGKPELWIDRGLHLVLRAQSADPFTGGIQVDEIIAIRIGPVDGALFELPPGVTPSIR